jgi:peptidoglycan DL-endopeptidase CwlO
LTVSTRATARHRASLRPTTALSTLTSAVSEGAGTLGRGGVVIAMSSGLVATLGLPAHADAGPAADTGPVTAQLAALTVVDDPAAEPVTAPATATLVFEKAAFAAAGRRVRPRASTRITPSFRADRAGHRAGRAPFGSSRGQSVLSVAAQYLGVPYRFGGTSPVTGWDCSGAMQYLFGQVGISLPRSAAEQYAASNRISRVEAEPGDMVFFFSGGGHVYHAALYAGGGMIYDAGRTGSRFTKRAIWSSNVAFARVTG